MRMYYLIKKKENYLPDKLFRINLNEKKIQI
jgi:hypothetical protein